MQAEGAFTFGSVPVLNVGDAQIAQTGAILRYLCSAHNGQQFYPISDPMATARVDEVLENGEDWYTAVGPSIFEKDEDRKKAMRAELATTKLPRLLKQLTKVLERNGGKYLASKELSIADLKWFYILGNLKSKVMDGIPDLLVDTPEFAPLEAWYQRMVADEGLVY